MSNYLVVVSVGVATDRIEAWIKKNTDRDDYYQNKISEKETLHVVVKGVNSFIANGWFFWGMAFDSSSGIFSSLGLSDFKAQSSISLDRHWGSFLSFPVTCSSFDVSRDVFGAARILYTNGDGFGAFSDSLLVLGSLRRELGETLTLNHEVLYARSLLNIVAHQQLSPDTLYNEIAFVPAGASVALRDVKVSVRAAFLGFGTNEETYEELIYGSANAILSSLAAVSAQEEWNTHLHLSGGLDSRIVAAALQYGGFSHSVSSGGKGTSRNEDYEIAESLAKYLGVHFGYKGKRQSDDSSEGWFSRWGATHAGVYDGWGPSRGRPQFTDLLPLNGVGGEIARNYWGDSDVADLAARFAPSSDAHVTEHQLDAFIAQLGKGVKSLPFVSSSGLSDSNALYLGYRNSIHMHANTLPHHLHALSPLANLEWVKLGFSPHSSSESPALDLLLLFQPRLAILPFEGKRHFKSDQISRRLERLSSVPFPQISINNFGKLPKTKEGISSLGVSLASQSGFDRPLDYSDFREEALEISQELFPASLSAIFSKIDKNASWMLKKSKGRISTAGPSPVKIATLLLLKALG